MPVVFEPEYEALWHMFAEDSTTVADTHDEDDDDTPANADDA